MLINAMDADDAMGSFDPWGTGKYKGIHLTPAGGEAGVGGGAPAEDEVGGGGEPVAFKKRKGPSKGKFRKKARGGGE
ncbi:unnamed protein product [Discosporangium mesarthrocarpum]